MASLFVGHAAQKSSSSSSNLGTGFTRECIRFRENFAQCRATSKLHNLQYDEGGNHMAETETLLSMYMHG